MGLFRKHTENSYFPDPDADTLARWELKRSAWSLREALHVYRNARMAALDKVYTAADVVAALSGTLRQKHAVDTELVKHAYVMTEQFPGNVFLDEILARPLIQNLDMIENHTNFLLTPHPKDAVSRD